jgi:hypothetical protein
MTFHADDDIERVIYCIFVFEESVYIGRTRDIRHRMVRHQHPPFWAILETVKGFNKACERESFWKHYYQSHGTVLLNRQEPRRVPDSSPRPLKRLAELKAMLAKHGESDECLLWPYTLAVGYGIVPVGNGKNESVHRLSWKLAHPGESIPKGMDIMHAERCPHKHCFNQNHLSLGTRQENVDTAVKLGHVRQRDGKTTGAKNGRAILDELQVTLIRELADAGMSQRKIAKVFGVARGTIQFITTGKHWVHLLPEQPSVPLDSL